MRLTALYWDDRYSLRDSAWITQAMLVLAGFAEVSARRPRPAVIPPAAPPCACPPLGARIAQGTPGCRRDSSACRVCGLHCQTGDQLQGFRHLRLRLGLASEPAVCGGKVKMSLPELWIGRQRLLTWRNRLIPVRQLQVQVHRSHNPTAT